MKRVILGIFAHPDDDAFGASPTLLKERRNGSDIHLVLCTAGGAGANPDGVPDLAAIRLEEWRTSSELIGVSATHFLGYRDGELNNQTMIEIATYTEKLVQNIVNHQSPDEIELITLDLNGITGHVDHIAVARAVCLAYYRLKPSLPQLTRLRMACAPKSVIPTSNVNWIYCETGRSDQEIDEVVDAREYREQVMGIIRAHHSQRHDGERYIAERNNELGINHFIVMK